MKDIEEIKKTLSYVKEIDINTYSAEIVVGKYKGSVVFSNNERGYEHVSFCPYNGRLPDWSLGFLHVSSLARLFRARRWDDEQMERK